MTTLPKHWYSMIPFGIVGVMYSDDRDRWCFADQGSPVQIACMENPKTDHLECMREHANWIMRHHNMVRRMIEEDA